MSSDKSLPRRPSVRFELVKGVGGFALYLNDKRIAGEKPRGCGSVVANWTVDAASIRAAAGDERRAAEAHARLVEALTDAESRAERAERERDEAERMFRSTTRAELHERACTAEVERDQARADAEEVRRERDDAIRGERQARGAVDEERDWARYREEKLAALEGALRAMVADADKTGLRGSLGRECEWFTVERSLVDSARALLSPAPSHAGTGSPVAPKEQP